MARTIGGWRNIKTRCRKPSDSNQSPSETIGKPWEAIGNPSGVTGSPLSKTGSDHKVPEAPEVFGSPGSSENIEIDVMATIQASGCSIEVLEPSTIDIEEAKGPRKTSSVAGTLSDL